MYLGEMLALAKNATRSTHAPIFIQFLSYEFSMDGNGDELMLWQYRFEAMSHHTTLYSHRPETRLNFLES